jgi:hypothetical protein
MEVNFILREKTMSRFAVINGGIVQNVIVCESLEDAETLTGTTCVAIEQVPGGPGMGWRYENEEFLPPIEKSPTIEEQV